MKKYNTDHQIAIIRHRYTSGYRDYNDSASLDIILEDQGILLDYIDYQRSIIQGLSEIINDSDLSHFYAQNDN